MKRLLLLCSLFFLQFMWASAGISIYDTLQITHTDLHLDILRFREGILRGKADISVKSKMEDLDYVPLQLLQMQVDSVLVNGNLVTGFQYNDTLLRIPMNPGLKKGEEACVSVVYHGQPVNTNFGGFAFVDSLQMAYNIGVGIDEIPHSFGRAWYPCIDDFRARNTFDLFFRIEHDKKMMASGVLQDTVPHKDGTMTWHWHVSRPIPDYLLAVSVAPYVPLHWEYTQASGKVIPIDVCVLPRDVEAARETYSIVPKTLELMEKYFGEYEFDRVGYSTVNLRGGAMEHVNNISMSKKPTPSVDYQTTVIHELIHAWFGNRVTCATAGDMWLNEGITTFCTGIILSDIFPASVASEYIHHTQSAALLSGPRGDGGFYPLACMPETATYGSTTYDKGAMVMYALRSYLGDDLLYPALRDYVSTYSFRHATTQDFENFVSKHTGKDLTDFFDLYVNRPGFVAFEIDSIVGLKTAKGYSGTLYLQQKLQGAPEYGRNVRVPVRLFDRTGKESRKAYFTVNGSTSSYPLQLPFEPVYGIVDPDYELCKASMSETIQMNSKGSYAARPAYMSLECKALPAPVTLYAELYNVAPDPIRKTSDRQLSGTHYWRVTGNLPQGTKISASFALDSKYLAAPLLDSGSKCIYIMYRTDPGSDWITLQKFTVEGNPRQQLTIKKLMPGEYCLAI